MAAPKATTVKTNAEQERALADYRAEQAAVHERMAQQRAARLSATTALKCKNRC